MKLELKHLAPYLPYKLRFRDSYAGDVSTYTLSSNQLSHWESGHIKPFLPILRPLSDLTKEIEHNGEKFIPKEELRKLAGAFEPDNDFKNPFTIHISNEKILCFTALCMRVDNYLMFEKLFEWHFDVFGLIEKELAIDINSLNK